MSAEILREAAALMRERAEAATPGPWEHHRDHGGRETGDGELLIGNIGDSGGGRRAADFIGKCWGWGPQQPNAAHIASWHPAVALAVADWLDDIAARHQRTESVTVAEVDMAGGMGDFERVIDEAHRVFAGGEVPADWTERAVLDAEGEAVAALDDPVACCTHRIQDETWPCPEIVPALAVARAYMSGGSDV